MNSLYKVILCLSIFFSVPSFAYASTYFVSNTGSDTNSGTIDKPWKTLSKATSGLVAGDTLNIRGGVYQERLTNYRSGTASTPIVISAYGNEEVIIDGNANTFPAHDSGTPLVMISGDWVTLRNVTVRYSGDLGIVSSGKHVTLDNLYVHHNWAGGIVMTGDYDVTQNSRAWYNSTTNEYNRNQGTANGAGISCARYPDYCTIRHNVVWDTWGESISVFEALHAVIEDNISYDGQVQYYVSDTKYSVLQRNIAYCTPGNYIDSYETQNGIAVGDEKGVPIPLGAGGTRYPSSDNKIINNIVVGCNRNLAARAYDNTLFAFNTFVNDAGTTSEPYNVLFFAGAGTNVRFVNNIIVQDDSRPIGISSAVGITFSNNVWSKAPPANMLGSNSIVGNPLLSRQGSIYAPGWYTLLSGSPAINKALVLTEVATDYSNVTRGTLADIGALEYGSGTTPTPTVSSRKTPTTTIQPTNTPRLTPTNIPTPVIKPGDANKDGVVDEVDYGIWLEHYGQVISGGSTVGDFNVDGKIDGVDYTIWLKNL